MKVVTAVRTALVAIVGFAGSSSTGYADSGYVRLTIYKAGWIIGGSGGSGVLDFHGRTYGLSTGGLDYGLVFGGSKTVLRGRVRQHQPAVGCCGRSSERPARGLPSAPARERSC